MTNKFNIVLISNNHDNSDSINELLKADSHAGYLVTVVNDFSSVTKHLKDNPINLILIDVGSSYDDGLRLLDKVKNMTVDIPVIILVDTIDDNYAVQFLEKSAQDVLNIKTLNSAKLSKSIVFSVERNKVDNDLRVYQNIINTSNQAVFSIDNNNVIKLSNKFAENLYGYKPNELLGVNLEKLIAPECSHDELNLLKSIHAGSQINNHETIHVTKSGKRFDVSLNMVPIKKSNQQVTSIAISTHDISTRKQNEVILAIQFRIVIALSEASEINSAAHNVLKTICEIMDFQIGEIWAVDANVNALRHVAIWHQLGLGKDFEEYSKSMLFHSGEDLPGKVWQTNYPIFFEDLNLFSINAERMKLLKSRLQFCIGIPILANDEILGVSLFFSEQKKELNIKYKTMFANIGKQMGTFIRRKRIEGNLLYLAEHDVLTGLGNRNSFERSLNESIQRSKQLNRKIAILFLDLDFFKKINDNYGHEVGDRALQIIADRLRECIRINDVVARFGGDEFAIILQDILNIDVIHGVATKILNVVSKPIVFENKECFVTASIGISIYPNDDETPDELFRKADLAMYQVKDTGRNNYQFSSRTLFTIAKVEFEREGELHHALDKNEIKIFYQPIMQFSNSKIIGVESLVRWQHPSGILLSPINFIPLAIKANMINPLGDWIVKHACVEFTKWAVADLKFVAINITTMQLTDDLYKYILNILKEVNLTTDKIVLEVTENTLMTNNSKTRNILNQLKDIGLHISIDDFGTGYSSLSYIQSFHIDSIKIDKSFVNGVPHDANSVAIIYAIIAMVRQLGLEVIAEGIETQEQFDFLKNAGCDLAQGYFISKPLPTEEIPAFISQFNRDADV